LLLQAENDKQQVANNKWQTANRNQQMAISKWQTVNGKTANDKTCLFRSLILVNS